MALKGTASEMRTFSSLIVACAMIALASCKKIPNYQERLFDGNYYFINIASLTEKKPLFLLGFLSWQAREVFCGHGERRNAVVF